jgi:hypothetical protein
VIAMLLQSSHDYGSRGLDAYFTPIEAVLSLMRIESLPATIWEPAAGDGAIVRPLQAAGHRVVASDLADYGFDGCETPIDYLTAAPRPVGGIVTNPPFRLAARFAKKAICEVPYGAAAPYQLLRAFVCMQVACKARAESGCWRSEVAAKVLIFWGSNGGRDRD